MILTILSAKKTAYQNTTVDLNKGGSFYLALLLLSINLCLSR